jgi:hypothetical protein
MRLSTKEYWDSIYEKQTARGLDNNRTQKQNDITLLKKLFNTRIAEYVKNYDRYILWEVIYRRYMPRIPGLKALEVGSAPGKYLIQLNNRYGFLPYGVEYSPQGVKLNRDYFRLHNLNPDNVIHCDFFSHDFQYQYKGYFDIVVSRGFIEHFN